MGSKYLKFLFLPFRIFASGDKLVIQANSMARIRSNKPVRKNIGSKGKFLHPIVNSGDKLVTQANSMARIKNNKPVRKNIGNKGKSLHHILVKPENTEVKMFKIGWKFGNFFSGIVAFMITFASFFYLVAFIEDTPDFLSIHGDPGFSEFIDMLGIPLPDSGKAQFYKLVVAKSVCSTDIALVQAAIIFMVVFLGINLVLKWFGSIGSGNPYKSIGSQKFMQMAMIVLPGSGMLSTCLGFLSAGNVSKDVATLIIFGPTAIGIFGYLLATGFNSLVEYING